MHDTKQNDRDKQKINDGIKSARLAREIGDISRAHDIIFQLLREFPDQASLLHWKANALISERRLNEAAPVIERAYSLFPLNPAIAIERAWLAYHQTDLEEAIERWRSVIATFPDEVIAYRGLAMSLRDSDRLDEAEALLTMATTVFPSDLWLAGDHAAIPNRRQNFKVAVERWDILLSKFPEQPLGYSGLAAALTNSEHFDEAEAVLNNGINRFSVNLSLKTQLAKLAERRGNWPDAAARWAGIRDDFPDNAEIYIHWINALVRAELPKDAEALAQEAMSIFPNNLDLALRNAQCAMDRGGIDEAISRFEAIIIRFPPHPMTYCGLAKALSSADRTTDADKLLEQAMQTLPTNIDIFCEYAFQAAHRGLATESLRRWEEASTRFPDTPKILKNLSTARDQAVAKNKVQADLSGEAHLALSEEPALDLGTTIGTAPISTELVKRSVKETFIYDAAKSMIDLATVATNDKDWELATNLWRQVRKRFPTVKEGYIFEALALREIGQFSEADELTAEMQTRFPKHRNLYSGCS